MKPLAPVIQTVTTPPCGRQAKKDDSTKLFLAKPVAERDKYPSMSQPPYLSLIERQLSHDDRGIACYDRICWHILGNNGSRSNDSPLPHRDAAQNHCAGPNPSVIPNFDRLRSEER